MCDEKSTGGSLSPKGYSGLSLYLAMYWLDDLHDESQTSGMHARRREILFAVCFAESYIFEWVRDVVFANREPHDRHTALMQVFPEDAKRGVFDKWKQVVKQLKCESSVPSSPDFGQKYWENFHDLVNFRDGIIHAAHCRPSASAWPQIPDDPQPVPTYEELLAMKAGWAKEIVIELVGQLHAGTKTLRPYWLQERHLRWDGWDVFANEHVEVSAMLWSVTATKGEQTIEGHGATEPEAFEQVCKQAESLGMPRRCRGCTT
jgi:hypothetical protein